MMHILCISSMPQEVPGFNELLHTVTGDLDEV